jgi:hypothetical protein
MLSIFSGYDPRYLTRAVAAGRENYYLSAVAEHGEPPGIWTGAGCPELGLRVGSEVDGPALERLYERFIDPRDPDQTATLGRAPATFTADRDKAEARIERLLAAEPDATPERRDELVMQALQERRATVFFFDATFSVPKSVSLLHASLQVSAQQARQQGREAEAGERDRQAQAVWDGIMAANQAMLDYLQREAGYSRAGYHSAHSGRFADAHEWVIASFAQHTSRDADPQLHVHNAILNRVLREDPLASRPGDRVAWRTLDGAALFAARPAAGAIAERVLGEYLTDRLGAEIVPRADGNGWELAGVSAELMNQFSSRRKTIEPRLQELVAEYKRRHGREPHARALWSIAQFVTLDSRQPKAHSAPSRGELLARWEAQSRAGEAQALSDLPRPALDRRTASRSGGAGLITDAEIDRVLAEAVADALCRKSVFTRYELIRAINRHLPPYLGGLTGPQATALLDELAGRALARGGPGGTVLLTAPELVPVPDCYRRADGLSWWRRHGAEVYTTRGQLDTETRLLRAAAQTGAPAVAPSRAAAALGADQARIETALWREHARHAAPDASDGADRPLSGAGLSDDQAQAAYGVLTSGRAIDILIGAAGTGKTRVVAVIAGIWTRTGTGRVIGLTTSTNAAHVLAGEGITQTHNLADFLGKLPGTERTRGHLRVQAGDLLVVDESSMVPTADLAQVEAIATRCGAKILLTGDTSQLSAPGAGGAMRLLAAEHGYYQLRTVQRFEHEWERLASLRLRAGEHEVLADYDQRGRFLDGTREEMTTAATRRWLADHLTGHDALLLADTNVQAADLARRARDELAALGLVEREDVTELADGNVAGPGDLVVARRNAKIPAGGHGRLLANRDLLRIERWEELGEQRSAIVRRSLGRDPGTGELAWSEPFELPGAYVEEHVQLAYAGNVHVAEGRTVERTHLVASEATGREAFYVAMSRGRQRNTAYLVHERTRISDPSPKVRAAPDIRDPAAGKEPPWRIHRYAVLGAILDREQGELAATEVMRRELDDAASLATLGPVWTDLTRTFAARGYDEVLRSLLSAGDWQRYEQDTERGTLARLLRAAELAGHDPGEVLARAVSRRGFDDARSVAGVLHGRVQRIVGTAEPAATVSYAERTPRIGDPEAAGFAADLAAAMDARAGVLGERAALDRPVWALRYLGDVPADPLERAEWVRRAGAAAAYREERGYDSATEAIGPAPERGAPELRASWHIAFTALRMPELGREIAAAADGELLVRRAAYEREARWAPPYVAAELREAAIAADTYHADAVLAWYRADAAADLAERESAQEEAEALSVLAQEVGAHRDALAEIDEARRAWHAATDATRQRALAADTELRRRHPGIDLPLLETEDESVAETERPEPRAEVAVERAGAVADLAGALEMAREVHRIIAEREQDAGREAELDSDDLMRRREADLLAEAAARQNAVWQEPAASRRAERTRRAELEMEAGQ